jgi:hypothetical protein
MCIVSEWGTRQRSSLRHCATSQKVAGSIPVEITGYINLPNTSSRILALASTQPLTERSTVNLPGSRRWLERKADILITTCDPTV